MKNQIPLIAIAIFSIVILLGQIYVNNHAYAITIETATFGATGSITSTQFKTCEYVSTTIVWCVTTTGAYIWNPTSRSVTGTVYSSLAINDVECDSTYCFTWHLISDGGDVRNIANLTMWSKSGGSAIDSYLFNLNAGAQAGYGIALIPAQSGSGGTTTILVPVEGQTCLDGVTPLGNTDDKGICFIAVEPSNPFPLDGTRFINSGATSDTAVNFDVIWNGDYASIGSPTANRAEVKHRDAAGNFQYYNLNLADSDTTFALTQICNSGTVSGGLSQQAHMIINDGVLYDSTSNDIWTMDTTNSSCAEVQKTNPVDESIITGISFSATDNIFLITSTTDGSVETNSLNVFNGTTFGAGATFDRLLKLNLTSTANNFVWFPIVHQSEGEVHVWRGTQMVIISELLTPDAGEPVTGSGIDCTLPENENILICRLGGDGTLGSAGAFVIGNTTQGTGILGIGCSIGLVDCTSDSNPQTNGLGILIFIASIFVIVGMFYKSLGASATFQLPVFIWVIIIVALSAFFTITGLIDPVFLILSIVAVIALAAPKVIGIIQNRGGGFGGGGSTE